MHEQNTHKNTMWLQIARERDKDIGDLGKCEGGCRQDTQLI